MKTSDKLKKYPKQYWLIPLVILILPLVVEFFVRDVSYQWSLNLIINLQKWMNKKSLSVDALPTFYSVLTYTTLNMFYMLLCVLVYNFLNVYKCFILLLSIFRTAPPTRCKECREADSFCRALPLIPKALHNRRLQALS